MKIQLLPSSFDEKGCASLEQRYTCFLIDDCVTIDAGSLATAVSDEQREKIRNVIITHPHMDHIASLPIFIDDLFASLKEPVCVHATQEVINLLERDIFNWTVYPRFSGLKNEHGVEVMRYVPFEVGQEFTVGHLTVRAVNVNHIVPNVGLIFSDGEKTVGLSSDTAETEDFWEVLNAEKHVDGLLIETSFPNDMSELAWVSRHFTPATLDKELTKFNHKNVPTLVVHIKPTYREIIVKELLSLGRPNLKIMRSGHEYEF